MFNDIFEGLDEITQRQPEQPEGWDSGNAPVNPSVPVWDSGQKENLWRSGNQFWDTGIPRVPVENQHHDQDVDYDPDVDEDEEDFDDWRVSCQKMNGGRNKI